MVMLSCRRVEANNQKEISRLKWQISQLTQEMIEMQASMENPAGSLHLAILREGIKLRERRLFFLQGEINELSNFS